MTTEREDGDPRDARVSARYRELAREEPPARLDAAILEAARARAARPGMRRWALPASIAAVLVLSVLVTTRIHEEAPDFEPLARAPAEPAAKPATPPAPAAAKPAAPAAAEAPQRRQAVAPIAEKRAPAPVVAAPAAAPAPAAELQAARRDERSAERSAPAAAAAGALADRAAAREGAGRAAYEDSPQEWLEHIARLRAERRDAEADESLARFRRRYPDYVIPEPMRAKVLAR